MQARVRIAARFLAALVLWPAWAPACESCRNALADDPAALGFSKGIYASIVVLLGVVFTLLAFFIRYIVKEARRENGGAGGDL